MNWRTDKVGPGIVCGQEGHNLFTIPIGVRGKAQCLRCGLVGFMKGSVIKKSIDDLVAAHYYPTSTTATAETITPIPMPDNLPPDFNSPESPPEFIEEDEGDYEGEDYDGDGQEETGGN